MAIIKGILETISTKIEPTKKRIKWNNIRDTKWFWWISFFLPSPLSFAEMKYSFVSKLQHAKFSIWTRTLKKILQVINSKRNKDKSNWQCRWMPFFCSSIAMFFEWLQEFIHDFHHKFPGSCQVIDWFLWNIAYHLLYSTKHYCIEIITYCRAYK